MQEFWYKYGARTVSGTPPWSSCHWILATGFALTFLNLWPVWGAMHAKEVVSVCDFLFPQLADSSCSHVG